MVWISTGTKRWEVLVHQHDVGPGNRLVLPHGSWNLDRLLSVSQTACSHLL